MRLILGCEVLEIREPYTRTRLRTKCRQCGEPLNRSYSAVRQAEPLGGCICIPCQPSPLRRAPDLDPYLVRIVDRYATTTAQASTLRALLATVAEDEPVKVSSLDFWRKLASRLKVSAKTQDQYVRNAKASTGAQ